MEKYFIGIDLGGTNTKMGVVNAQGKVFGEFEQPTPTDPEKAIKQMAQDCKQLARQADIPWEQIGGIGIGLPGFLDIPNGKILNLTNLNWGNIPIRGLMEELLQKRVQIDNDANVAAFGEAWCGAGKEFEDCICVTLGTGVGGGIIVQGKLVYGLHGFAGEIGHIQIDPDGVKCNCGQVGCLETISSATGITRLAEEAIAQGQPTALPRFPTAYEVFQASMQDDPVGSQVVKKAIEALALAFAQLSVILNPACFVIGGGVSKAGDALLNPLKKAYQKCALSHVSQGVQIVQATLGNQAGFIGAAGLVAKVNN